MKHGVMVAYDGLPAPDIYAKEEVALLGRILTRAARYDEKYARQEVALLGLLHPFLSSGRKVGVLEIGAGNANLACLVHLIYGTVHEQLQPCGGSHQLVQRYCFLQVRRSYALNVTHPLPSSLANATCRHLPCVG
jgi:hypothetical protein